MVYILSSALFDQQQHNNKEGSHTIFIILAHCNRVERFLEQFLIAFKCITVRKKIKLF